MFGSGADRQHQLGRGGGRRVFVIDDGERQRAGLARHLGGFDDVGAAPGLRHHDEQGIAHVRRPLVGGHDGRRGGGSEQAEPRFEQVAQINADMTRAAAPAEHDDARLGLLDPFGDRGEQIGARQQTLGHRRNFGGLARHRACGLRFSHPCLWTR